VLRQYLCQRRRCVGKLEESLRSAGSQKAETRLQEVQDELRQIEAALDFFGRAVTEVT